MIKKEVHQEGMKVPKIECDVLSRVDGINLIKLSTNPLIYIFNNWIIFSTKFSSVDKVLKIYIKVGYISKRISYIILLLVVDKLSKAEVDIDFNITNNFVILGSLKETSILSWTEVLTTSVFLSYDLKVHDSLSPSSFIIIAVVKKIQVLP